MGWEKSGECEPLCNTQDAVQPKNVCACLWCSVVFRSQNDNSIASYCSDFSALHARAESGSPELLGSKFGTALAPEHRL